MATTKPGVQKPHWAPWQATMDSWKALRPSAGVRPSTVTTWVASSWATWAMHEVIDR